MRSRQKQLSLLATIIGSSLSISMGTITNVALPSIQTSLVIPTAATQWVVNAYLLPVAALILLGGTLGDRYGRKIIFLIRFALFLLGSAVCALAPGLSSLLTGRVLQGLGSALLAPNSLAIIGALFPRDERGQAVGRWAGAGAVAGAIAPVIGGWLIDAASWRWAFGAMLVPGLIGFAVAALAIPETRVRATYLRQADWLGAAMACGAMLLLTRGIIAWPSQGLSATPVLSSLLGGAAITAAFLGWQKHLGDQAMVPPALFANPGFVGLSALTLFLYAALAGLLLLLPYTLIRVHEMSASHSGLALLPLPLVIGFLSGYAGKLSVQASARTMLIAGPMAVAAGFMLIATSASPTFSYWLDIFPGLLLLSLGMAASVTPLTTAVINAAEDSLMGLAAGINNAVSRLAGLLAVAFLGFTMTDEADPGHGEFLARFVAANQVGALLATLAAVSALMLIDRHRVGAAGKQTPQSR